MLPLLASFALPAAAQLPRFGLRLEALFEHQESLEVSAFRGSIRARDLLRSTEETGALPGDSALLNRKFDLLWELKGAGAQLPIELPELGVFSPRMVLEAAVADVSLDFLDRTVPADSTSLSGRGPLFAAELEVEGSPWGMGPWSWAASLRWQKLPSLTMDRSPGFGAEGFQVANDEVRLSQEVQEITTRFGYTVPSGRTKPYLGVRHRRTDLEIEDDVGYVDPLRQIETSLSSRSELYSDVLLAVAGVEARSGGRLYGRLETALGDEDIVVLVQALYVWPRAAESEDAEMERRAREIAAALAPRLAAIEAEFLAGWRNLAVVERSGGEPAYLRAAVEALLARTERDLLSALGEFSELDALAAWVRDEFLAARAGLEPAGDAIATGAPPGAVHARLVRPGQPVVRGVRRAQAAPPTVDKNRTDSLLGRVAERPVGTTARLVREGSLYAQLTFRTPLPPGTTLLVYPRYNRDSSRRGRLSRGERKLIWRGHYAFQVQRKGNTLICCGDERSCFAGSCPLELVLAPCAVLSCDRDECLAEICR